MEQLEQLPFESNGLARCFRLEGDALCARLGPLPLTQALSGIARQSALAAPAKFTISRSGEAEIQAEIPLVAERQVCEKLADAALDAALLLTSAGSDPGEPDRAAFSDPEIESALSQIPWRFRQQDSGVFQIDAAPAPGHAMRVALVAQGGALRASTATSLRVGSPEIRRALEFFALESNSRLRLSRIGVAEENGTADIVWEGVVAATLPAAAAIAPIVEAVVYAQMFTRRSLNVLTDQRIAEAYLRHRTAPKPTEARRRKKRVRGRSSGTAGGKRNMPVAAASENQAGRNLSVEPCP